MATQAELIINSSDYKSAAWRSQMTAYKLVSDLWKSPLYIRDTGQTYLEKFKNEKPEKYQERLGRSVPQNKFRESIETMAGMAFKDDPAPQDIPEPLSNLFTDIDACGNSLHSFCLTSFEKYLRDGGGAIWVSSTPLKPESQKKIEDGQPLTAQDRYGDRPLWIFVEAAQIINHRFETVNGIERLAQVTIECIETEPAGDFGEKEVKRHYILRVGSVEVQVYDEVKKEYVTESDKGGPTGLSIVPLVPLAPFGTPPPLLNLAMMDVQYYNKESDFDDWCHNACVPERIYNFDSKEDAAEFSKTITNSASVTRGMWGQHAKAYFCEVSGEGMDIAERRLEAVAARMASIGVGMLAPSDVAPKSATEVLDTSGQRQSKLARYAREFENAVEKAFYITAEILNIIGGKNTIDLSTVEKSSLKLKMDFDRLTFTPEKLKLFQDLLASGDISRLTFFEILGKSQDMPQNWSPEEEEKRLTDEDRLLTDDEIDTPNPNDTGTDS